MIPWSAKGVVSITERLLDFHIRRIIIEEKRKNNDELQFATGRVYHHCDKYLNCVRTREIKIGNTTYCIISSQKPSAKSSAFDIAKRLITNQAESLVNDEPITTESLEDCNSGGKKQ